MLFSSILLRISFALPVSLFSHMQLPSPHCLLLKHILILSLPIKPVIRANLFSISKESFLILHIFHLPEAFPQVMCFQPVRTVLSALCQILLSFLCPDKRSTFLVFFNICPEFFCFVKNLLICHKHPLRFRILRHFNLHAASSSGAFLQSKI